LGRGDRDYVEHWTNVGERALETAGADAAAPYAAGIAVLRAAVARGGLAQMAADAARGGRLAGDDVAWRSLACWLDGAARHLSDDRDAARERLTQGTHVGSVGGPVAEMLCHAQLALMDLLQDSWEDGARHAGQARECMDAHGLADLPASALTYSVAALSGAHDGDVKQAREDVAAAHRLLRLLRRASPWLVAESQVALARAELRLSDSLAARDLLIAAGRLARRCPDAIVVRTAIDDGWQQVDQFAAAAVAGVSALTTAELRVLRMLPSHMSLSEIAARLHVSMNTVKTQAHAVYRKLDVSSRSDAVARARTVGLIDP
jgi:LuxR family maltose regulon positive regulatory protein